MIIGYARISTEGQSLDPQIDQLKKAGCERIFTDVMSGSKSERPGYYDAIKFARDGDTIVVVKLDRLGRSVSDLIAKTNELSNRNIEFKSLSESIDTSTVSGKLLFHVMAALAEFERGLIKERTMAGLEAARARGRVGGRPGVLPVKIAAALAFYDQKSTSVNQIRVATGVSSSTLYRELAKRKIG